jgi:hypothetical protein
MEIRYTVAEAKARFGEEAIQTLLNSAVEQTGRSLVEDEYKFDEWRSQEVVVSDGSRLRAYYNMPCDIDIFGGVYWTQLAEIVEY